MLDERQPLRTQTATNQRYACKAGVRVSARSGDKGARLPGLNTHAKGTLGKMVVGGTKTEALVVTAPPGKGLRAKHWYGPWSKVIDRDGKARRTQDYPGRVQIRPTRMTTHKGVGG